MSDDGFRVLPGYFDRAAQEALLADVLARVDEAPFGRAHMPRSGAPMSVEMTNFGPLGWWSDRDGGYRYQRTHPATGQPWPPIPPALLRLWAEVSGYPAPPEACLVNLYRNGARLGMHIDADEDAALAPVVSVSLGDAARFRLGGATRGGPTRALTLSSGDVVVLGGASRRFYHGVDKVLAGTSALVPGGGRINLTLRRVTRPEEARSARIRRTRRFGGVLIHPEPPQAPGVHCADRDGPGTPAPPPLPARSRAGPEEGSARLGVLRRWGPWRA